MNKKSIITQHDDLPQANVQITVDGLPASKQMRISMEDRMKTPGKLIVAGCAAFVLLQLIRPAIPDNPSTAELQAPPEVKRIIEKNCYSCHSDQRRLSWFDQIVPAYWLVRHDVLTARQHLNFS